MPTDIHRVKARQLIEAGAQLVETLSEKEYKRAHLPGALNIPLDKLKRESVKQLQRDQPTIVYCYDYQ
jgi:rhodanese-related sulfurtransferase